MDQRYYGRTSANGYGRCSKLTDNKGNRFIYPTFIKTTSKIINDVPLEDFKKIISYVESTLFKPNLFEETPLPERDKKKAEEIGVSLRAVQWTGGAYVNLLKTFMQESSEREFIENLSVLGLEKERAQAFWDSFIKNKEDVPSAIPLDDSLLSIMPKLTEVAWRVGKSKASFGQTISDSTWGIISISLEDTRQNEIHRFEVDISSLSYLIEELLKMQKQMSE